MPAYEAYLPRLYRVGPERDTDTGTGADTHTDTDTRGVGAGAVQTQAQTLKVGRAAGGEIVQYIVYIMFVVVNHRLL
jgi:hypothetical protein